MRIKVYPNIPLLANSKVMLLGTLFDPCRLAYLTYTSNDSVRPPLAVNFLTKCIIWDESEMQEKREQIVISHIYSSK
jgi:hypothetical protein